MERDEDIADLIDRADWTDRDLDEAAGEAAYADEVAVEQYDMLEKALDECKAKGVSVENLRTLVRETGMTQWGLQNSLKTPEPRREGLKDF
jgi:hypothetical protein